MSLYDELLEMGAYPQYASRPGQTGDLAPAYGGREADEMLLALQFMQGQEANAQPNTSLYDESAAMIADLQQQIAALQGTLATPDAGLTDYLSWPESDESGPFRGVIDERMGDESGPFRGPSSTYMPPPPPTPPWGRHDPNRIPSAITLDPRYEWGPRIPQPRRQPGLIRRPSNFNVVEGVNRGRIGARPRYNS